MSTFSGIMNEFPCISVDRFDNDNLHSNLFFLSHCHMDHMTGLNNPNGIPGPLFLSPISSVIVRKQYPHIKQLVVLKENGKPTPIKYTDVDGQPRFVTVTTVPAFHCPGSVMFLYEQDNVKVLYTGDFRLSKRNMAKIKQLKILVGSIDTMYIDSTFLSADYQHFPGQIRSAITICDIIREWLDNSPRHIVSLKMPAHYGYELLYIEIGKRLQLKIHINAEEMEKYRYIPELDDIFTTATNKSQIHACFDYHNKNGKNLTCDPDIDPKLIRVIKPTAMIWREWEESFDFVKKEANETVRVCYSNHSSMSEIRDFMVYLQPKNVELNVVPSNAVKKQQMLDAVSEIMRGFRSTNCRHESVHLSNWDNLGKISKLNFKFTRRSEEQPVNCAPKRRKN